MQKKKGGKNKDKQKNVRDHGDMIKRKIIRKAGVKRACDKERQKIEKNRDRKVQNK